MNNSIPFVVVHTKGDTHTCSGIPSHGWINSSPCDTPLSHTHTHKHTHICACVDHLLTMLCNSSTCLGLRLLFPSKERSPCQDWMGLDSCSPVVFVSFLSPCSLPTSGLEPCIIHLDQGKPLPRCH